MQIRELKNIEIDNDLIRKLDSWGIEFLTDIQVKALSSGVAKGNSMVVCAPTSSGKTLVAEIAVYTRLKENKKTLYLVSHKALADQKYEDFQRKFGELSNDPIASICLSTGDREEGNYDALLQIATYEKALSLLVSNQIDPNRTLIIADELQIIGEPGRGPDIESLCAILIQRNVDQFVALTATVQNPNEIAAWLNCQLVTSQIRDVDLFQEIWHEGNGYRLVFGQEDGQRFKPDVNPHHLINIVDHLLSSNQGPILVFTESRREAAKYANDFSQARRKAKEGLHLAQQLDLFSEPTEFSEQLGENAEKRVTFHSADLTPQQKQVIENGFLESRFDACFATSTLAAGVNFPFKTVIFPKLTYEWGDRAGTQITRSDYRNMSGRAGRLGMHDKGISILLPKNKLELAHANKIILPENDNLNSQLVNLSMRRSVLVFVASGIVDSRDSLAAFLKHTFYWHQLAEKNQKKLESILSVADQSIDWLLQNELISEHEKLLHPTPIGKAISRTGLLPSTAVSFLDLLKKFSYQLENNFDDYEISLLYWVCSSDEFNGDTPSRFLPFTRGNSAGSVSYITAKRLLYAIDQTNTQLCQSVHALSLFMHGENERRIQRFSGISSGYLHRLAMDASWILDGLHKITCVQSIGCSQQLSNRIAMLSRRVRWGSPAEILDIIRVAEKYRVPGFGRQRAMLLLEQGISTFHDIISSGKEKLIKLLKREERISSLLEAISHTIGFGTDRLKSSHLKAAEELGITRKVENCYTKNNVEYEVAIVELLKIEERWSITKLDDGKRQNVPDLLLEYDEICVLIECKTSTKQPAMIKKEDAYAVLQKADDFDPSMYRVCLGKPAFDEHCKKKAQASSQITLIEHSIFIEGVLRVISGSVSPKDFIDWICKPGVTEIDRLPGIETYSIHKNG